MGRTAALTLVTLAAIFGLSASCSSKVTSSGDNTSGAGSAATAGSPKIGGSARGGSGATGGAPAATGGGTQSNGGTQMGDFCPPQSSSGGTTGNATGGFPAVLGCGDGILHYKIEDCDDGNLQSGDGCSSTCKLEPGWTCDHPGQPCRLQVCGNGLIETPETCDDYNKLAGDGCSDKCQVENGWVCIPSWECRQVRCGDGRLDNSNYIDASGKQLLEYCDDGNTQSGDGCSSVCTIEDGWYCAQPDSTGYDLGIRSGYYIDDTSPPCLAIVCGDRKIEPPEKCDDGNTVEDDGCPADCSYIPGLWNCPAAGQPCVPEICGDGIVDPNEQCDDGNAQPGDGCDAHCVVEPNELICDPPGQLCHPAVCGNGKQELSEQCDDGNSQIGDGCTPDCVLEPGWTCSTNPPCHQYRCGDGHLDGPEIFLFEDCDDGNAQAGDGCSDTCATENGWTCDTPGQPCRLPTCGNGKWERWEQCDDGNTQAGDGCSDTCTLEPMFRCATVGEACQLLCGDGKLQTYTVGCVDWHEQCDDGNTRAGDGCSPHCALEPGWHCGVPGKPCWSL